MKEKIHVYTLNSLPKSPFESLLLAAWGFASFPAGFPPRELPVQPVPQVPHLYLLLHRGSGCLVQSCQVRMGCMVLIIVAQINSSGQSWNRKSEDSMEESSLGGGGGGCTTMSSLLKTVVSFLSSKRNWHYKKPPFRLTYILYSSWKLLVSTYSYDSFD